MPQMNKTSVVERHSGPKGVQTATALLRSCRFFTVKSAKKVHPMKDHNRSMALNKANWDERAPLHAASAEYDVEAYIDDPRRISGTLRFDQPLLGDIRGLRGIHLQCHIGTDTISLARLGASMTGLDFSPGIARPGPRTGRTRRNDDSLCGKRGLHSVGCH